MTAGSLTRKSIKLFTPSHWTCSVPTIQRWLPCDLRLISFALFTVSVLHGVPVLLFYSPRLSGNKNGLVPGSEENPLKQQIPGSRVVSADYRVKWRSILSADTTCSTHDPTVNKIYAVLRIIIKSYTSTCSIMIVLAEVLTVLAEADPQLIHSTRSRILVCGFLPFIRYHITLVDVILLCMLLRQLTQKSSDRESKLWIHLASFKVFYFRRLQLVRCPDPFISIRQWDEVSFVLVEKATSLNQMRYSKSVFLVQIRHQLSTFLVHGSMSQFLSEFSDITYSRTDSKSLLFDGYY